MGRNKFKSAMRSSSSGGGRGRSPGAAMVDKQLLRRVEAFAAGGGSLEGDAVAEGLRTSYREYGRVKAGPFRSLVERALEVVQRRAAAMSAKDGADQPAAASARSGSPFAGGGACSSDESSGEDGEEAAMAAAEAAMEAAASGSARLNSSLLSMYGRAAPPSVQSPAAEEGAAAGEVGALEAGGAAEVEKRPGFAPPEIVAAAAAVAEAEVVGARVRGAQEAKLPERPSPALAEAPTGGRSISQLYATDADAALCHRAAPSKKARREGSLPGGARPSTGGGGRPSGGGRSLGGGGGQRRHGPNGHHVYDWLGVEPPRGVLLHGPPGCGKTALANAIANECGVPFLRVSAPEVVSGMSGESEAKLRELFRDAADVAPCIIFIDEIDAIAPKRENAQRQMEHRIVAQMLTCMDDLTEATKPPPKPEGASAGEGEAAAAGEAAPESARKHVVVIAATNRPDALDAALRRAGRFDREISLGIPCEAARAKILQVQTRSMRLSGEIDFAGVSKATPGFVGADLAALVKESAALAVKRCFQALPLPPVGAAGPDAGAPANADPLARSQAWSQRARERTPLSVAELGGLAITMADFQEAVGKVQPSVRREGFATTPDVTWDDVGSLSDIREELSFAITEPIKFPQRFAALGLSAPCGVLLFGPPGCGKTLVAKAVANESGANFISIKGPELLNKYVGESERAVRQLFTRARAAAPCVLFFDELDALAPRRGGDGNQAAERVVNQLLTEMDGFDGRQSVYLVAATNRPDMIDPALLRPGRLDKILYVPLPDAPGRASILSTLTRRTPLSPDVDCIAVAEAAAGFSGADMAALVREACVRALKEMVASQNATEDGGLPGLVEARHFAAALRSTTPSVSPKDQRVYNALRSKLKSARGHLNEPAPGALESGAPGSAAGGEPSQPGDGTRDMTERSDCGQGEPLQPMETA
eukprot:jgi/Tetstr1/435519/TSEL_024423.t1